MRESQEQTDAASAGPTKLGSLPVSGSGSGVADGDWPLTQARLPVAAAASTPGLALLKEA